MGSLARQTVGYGISIGVAVLLICWVIQHGTASTPALLTVQAATQAGVADAGLFDALKANLARPLSRLLISTQT